MVQEIITEHLDRCPFCGGKAEMKVAGHPLSDSEFVVRVSCIDCHCMSNSYQTGQTIGFQNMPSRYVTLGEAKAQAVKSWNRRPEVLDVPTDAVKIYPCFAEHPPRAEKMEQKEQYFMETGLLQSQIILDSRGGLIDGYTSYLLAKAQGIQSVPIRYGRRQIVKAFHRPGGKLYTWELPGLLIDRVHIGDKVIVRTERGVRAATVAAVEEYAGNEPEPLKMVVRVKKKRHDAISRSYQEDNAAVHRASIHNQERAYIAGELCERAGV